MTALVACQDGGTRVEVLCEPCADAAGFAAEERRPWTVEEWMQTGDADADGRPVMGPASCQSCGAGDLAAEAREEQDRLDALRGVL